jgi:hypothetical protein
MPAESKAQRAASAIAKHHPEDLYERNKGLLSMTQEQLGHYAGTSEKGLPNKKQKKRGVKGNTFYASKLLSGG